MLVTSSANPAVKFIRKLRSRKERERSGLFFADGVRVTLTALEAGARVMSLVVAPEAAGARALAAAERVREEGRIRLLEVTPEVYRTLTADDEPSGFGALVAACPMPLSAAKPTDGLCWVVLDGVQYPGNLGTILRTCDAVSVAGVILLGESTDPYHPAAVRASMGAVFTRKIVRASPADLATWAAGRVALVGASGEAGALPYRAAAYPRPFALVLGSEREGLSPAVRRLCHYLVGLPMLGLADSLNLSVAAGVLLYEALAQAESTGEPGSVASTVVGAA